MVDVLISFLLVVCSYFIGSFTLGYHLVKWKTKQDIRNVGSGNVGATNVSRVLGVSGFVITLISDCLKAVLMLFIVQTLNQPDIVIAVVIFALIVGHIWPFYLNFKGGKGIATALGVFLMIDINSVLIMLIISGLILLITQKFNLSWLLGLVVLLIFIVAQDKHSLFIVVSLFFSSFVIVYAHKSNIYNEFCLIKNNE